MIVISRRVGKLGNRLILFAHFIACARQNSVPVYNPAFHEYAQYFEATRHDRFCCYQPERLDDGGGGAPWEITRRLLYHAAYLPARGLAAVRCTSWPLKIVRISMQESYDLGSDEFTRLLQQRRVVVVQGWLFRDNAAMRHHADAIRAYFRPIRQHAANVSQIVAAAGGRGDVLVGVHCRQGDYRTAFAGRFYYTPQQYRAIMRRVVRFFAPRKVSFLVCGDELSHTHAATDLNITWGSGHPVEDMYAFAQCDYLVGPPSTFTGWASFYGDVPLCPLNSADAVIRFGETATRND